MLYLYGLVNSGMTPAPQVTGLESEPVFLMDCGGLAAAVSKLNRGWPGAERTNAVLHFEVLQSFVDMGAILPLRFGAAFTSAERLRSHVESRRDEYEAQLQRLRGKAEFNVAFSPFEEEFQEAPPIAATNECAGPGARYLSGRLATAVKARSRQSQAQKAAHSIASALGPRFDTGAPRPDPAGGNAVSIAVLVPVQLIACFTTRLSILMAACPKLSISCTGPWPPFSFVTPLVPNSQPGPH